MSFAMPDDYDSALESLVADVKQCTLDGEADHILAARFLQLLSVKHPGYMLICLQQPARVA